MECHRHGESANVVVNWKGSGEGKLERKAEAGTRDLHLSGSTCEENVG